MNGLQILRKGTIQTEESTSNEYIPSFYNFEYGKGNNYVIFNSASGAILKTHYSLISLERFLPDEIKELVSNGFIVPKDIDEVERTFNRVKRTGKETPNYFTIIPTTTCNAKCFYCYEEEYCKTTMGNLEVQKTIDYIVSNILTHDKFVLDWYGGEPLLCVSLIDKVIQGIQARVRIKEKSWESSITTNATLLSPELTKHAIEKWNLKTAHITLDGIEREHNIRKNISFPKGSAFRITLNAIGLLLQEEVFVNLRIHLDNNNKDNFDEVIKEIEPFFKYPNFHIFPTYLFPPEDDYPDSYIHDRDKEKLFYNVFKHLTKYERYNNLLELFPCPRISGCFATKSNTVVIAPNASLHSCVQDFSSNKNWHNDEKYMNFPSTVTECKQCKFFPICLGGCIYNKYKSGTVRTPCVRNRYIVLPLLQLLSEQIENKNTK